MKRTTIFALALAALATAASISFAQEADPKTRLQTAEKMFQERCKKAGEFIHRTAENVEGVFLMKIRGSNNRDDQYRMDDPYGHDSVGDSYMKSFFMEPMLLANQHMGPDVIESIRRDYLGYHYVEAIDPQDGKRYRYTGRIDQPWLRDKSYGEWVRKFVLDRQPASDPAPRYGVTYDDISTREERDYWIAGSSLKVIDLQTNEVMAERIGYMMDRGQGNKSGGRSPWLLAADNACPSFRPRESRQPGFSYQVGQTRSFVKKILKPIQEHKQ
jgi:hypothetical protein